MVLSCFFGQIGSRANSAGSDQTAPQLAILSACIPWKYFSTVGPCVGIGDDYNKCQKV